MKSGFPKTELGWMQLVLFPFKFCIFLIPLVFIGLMIETGTTFLDDLLIPEQIHLMVGGYVLCIIISAIGGIFTAVLTRNWKLMRSGLIYGGIGPFLLSMFILPAFAAHR